MTKRYESLIVASLTALVVAHMVITVGSYYASNDGVLAYSKFYTDELFFQRWNFFAPNPGILTEKLWIRCSNEGESSEWIDPVDEVLSKSYYSPLPSNYRRTYALRELTTRVNKSLSEITAKECQKQEFNPSEKTSSNSQSSDVSIGEISICKSAFDKVKKTKVYRDLVNVSKYICQQKFQLSHTVTPAIIISQKHPWPLSLADEASKESPYYKLSVVDFEKGVGECQKN